MANTIADAVLTYALLKRIARPFSEWPAYKLGIIDEDGKVLKKQKTLDAYEKKAWGRFDIVAANIKKLLNKIPGAGSKLGSIATATFLFKEGLNALMDPTVGQRLHDHLLAEEVFGGSPVGGADTGGASNPANVVGTGKIAGVGIGPQGEPPGRSKLKRIKSLVKRSRGV